MHVVDATITLGCYRYFTIFMTSCINKYTPNKLLLTHLTTNV